ncbi:PEGA domain-containing protein [Desulfobotulus alkaliphilus]|uniref:PEGA domain-containing protein n=1 Tax=Desulfobotulus alkaliphilus TaxID=622671 RepID=A0A562S0G8_9BACT|nr:PEGA domain-containing protein [Desulfobotulus alkaliphilus]TWI74424.1 PEGA domain-containing protein [Desulfobotulus alkaliphilus]
MRWLFCLMVLGVFPGCATMFSGSTDTITFKSVPEGAVVEIDGMGYGRTPVTVPVKKRSTPPQVQYKLEEYESRHVFLQNSFDAVGILNIFIWPGFIVDAVTGSMWKYDRYVYEVELEPRKK